MVTVRLARHRTEGFTYVWVLIAVAVMTAGLASVAEDWRAQAERSKQQELQWIAEQYVHAIGSYYEASPGGVKRYPPDLEHLLLDDRFVVTRRHLRRLYPNPWTQHPDWELVRAPDGGVQGIRNPAPDQNQRSPASFVYRSASASTSTDRIETR